MSRRCQVTGAAPGTGRHVSHSHVRTPRRFAVNVPDKRYRVPSLGRHVRLRLSAKGIKTVDRDAVDGRPRGHLRAFGLSHVRVRQYAHAGYLPGVTKSSW